ncbi:hypothetical protein OSB04_013987 [Centaurea solstitialis]|uniref:non-specific serine/threonine protein kinase n=1 Tax=Centaurea solstitialis TaxID=347529 RepID=A0AA38TYZ8_9ASTR|nr:hypothetical protein OSB04_013987 [Centaurea solstitialis]
MSFLYKTSSIILSLSCIFLFWFLSLSCSGDETDHLALLSVKKYITSDPYQIMPLWNDSVHFCNWTGIVCGLRHKRVVTLNLRSCGFYGSISPAVGNLTFLRELLLQNNSFTGNVPQEVGRLSRLRRINLSNNSLSGEIPSNISWCLNLVELDLRDNSFIGVIPNEFESLTKLQYIFLHSNELTGEIPKFIGNFTSLTILSSWQNHFHGNIPDTLGQLSNLWYINFGLNNLSGILPLLFFNISSLKEIDLPANQIGGNLPSDVGQRFLGLTVLNLAQNKLSGPIPLSLSNATNLQYLALNLNAFTGSVPSFSRLQRLTTFAVNVNQLGNGKSEDLNFVSSLANCTNLEVLGFGANNLGGVLPKSMFNFTLLADLTIGGNLISGNIPSEIGQLVDLRRLFLFSNQFTGRIPDSIGNLGNLGVMSLSGNLLSGSIPSSLGNLTKLSGLYLHGNKLEGTVPFGLSNCRGLQGLDLSRNNLSGPIPKGIFGLTSLTLGLDLSNNHFVGSLPTEVGALQNLVFFDVSNNMISGVIPVGLGSCTSLVKLFMAGNNIQGEIPSSFHSLRGLEVLDLSHNNLTGRIPEYLGDFVFFKTLNLSFNGFEGKLPEQGAFKNVSIVSIYGNAKLCGGLPEFQLPKCSHVTSSRKNHIPHSLLILIPAIILIFVLIVVVFYCFVCKHKKASIEIGSEDENFSQVSYQSLHEATGGFSSANLIGSGNFSSVYKATLYLNNEPHIVVVKVLKLAVHGADRSFIAECEALRTIRHRNLVKVLTCCSSVDYQGNDFKALVYSYMVNGSLEDQLHQNSVVGLNFLQRLNIVIDLAMALDYIHRQCGSLLIHCDIKPSNILLDADLVAHLGDFGLARFVHPDSSTSHASSLGIKGTIGYAAPEYGMGSKVSTYGDVYSFGILILELFTSNRPTNDMFSDGLSLHGFVKMAIPDRVKEITDPVLFKTRQEEDMSKVALDCKMHDGIEECLTSVYRIGTACSMEIPGDRIEISNALDQLQFVKKTFLRGRITSFGNLEQKLKIRPSETKPGHKMRTRGFKPGVNGIPSTFPTGLTATPQALKPRSNTSIASMNKMCFLSYIFLFCILSSVSSGDETDHLALLSIKNHITSDPYQIMPLWNESTHFCNWTGIICGLRHRRVVTLNLRSRGLSGSISPAIGNLSFLRDLVLANNSFTGNVPQEVGRLSRLRRVRLSNNSLSGEIPSNISRCSNLLELYLGFNNFSGVIPNEFGSLTKLQRILVDTNELTGEIPKFIGNFTSLAILSGTVNHFHGSIPDTLGQLSNLWYFGFEVNNLSGILPLSFFNISSLEEIHLTDNKIGGNLPPDISQRFLGLRALNLPENKFSGPIPFSLSNATNLEYLALQINAFTGSVPDFSRMQRLKRFTVNSNQLGNGKSDNLNFVTSLANCTNLGWLGFGANNLGGVLPKSMFNFTLLTELTIGQNLISGNIPYEIRQLVNIKRMILSENQFTGRIPDSIGSLRNLVALTLRDNLLSGSIPSSLGNLTQLSALYLRGNKIEGAIPSSLSECKRLQVLDLSRNNLSGYVPKGIFGLSSLTLGLDLSYNRLVGSLPTEVGSLQNMVVLDISNNMMSGIIPVSLGTCTSLVELVMAGNNFQGELPTSIRSLRGLEVLDLSRNNFTGRIPEYLGDFMFLNTLNLSLNGFDGKLPEEGAFRNVSKVSIYGNAKLCGGLPEFQLPKCSLGKSSRKKQIPLPFLITIPIISVLFVLIVVAACFVCKLKRKKASTESSSEDGNFQQVSYQSLHEATDGFSSANLIGSGKFSYVYKAMLPTKIEPEVVAVKVLKLAVHGADRSFIAECEALRSIRHRNLVKVVTCCSSLDFQGNDFKALVYSYMVNGSLEDWLHQNSVVGLNFLQRLNIAIDLAGALDYIHRQCGSLMIHCDIKPSNVLLDADLVAHLGDFGLARFVHPDSSTSHTSSLGIKGTIGYAAPEYGMGSKVSTYGDVYSFGILVLELFTGKRPTAEMFSDGLSLHGFVKMAIPDKVMEITDPVLFKTSQEETMIKDARGMEECLTSVYQIGSACSMEIPRDRIEISDALNQLQVVKRTFLKDSFLTFFSLTFTPYENERLIT